MIGSTKTAIVVGAGIVGLAIARSLALKGYSVQVYDRSEKAVGASIRNFGMIWPIGQPSGALYERAMRSRKIWKEIGDEGAFWYDDQGSLHVAHEPDEWTVLQELNEIFRAERGVSLLTSKQVAEKSEAVVQQSLKGALFSSNELIVDPRQAIASLPDYLSEKYNVVFHWEKSIHAIHSNAIQIGANESHTADLIFICTGTDRETLFPETFSRLELTTCKLQMMRIASQPQNWKIGPALCGGLSLIHYNSFKAASSLSALKKRYQQEMKEYLQWGIHVMVSQNEKGELTIGDSHEYGLTHDPFDKSFINEMIIGYLKKFAHFKDWSITESWHGLYTKQKAGEPHIFFSPEPGTYVLNALGGAGMTLSFGLAEEIIDTI